MERRVLVVAEGEHELADGSENASLVVLLVRLLRNIPLRVECRPIRTFTRRINGKGDRHARKLIAILQDAEKAGFDAVFVLIDQDADEQRQRAAAIAQESDFVTIPRALGVAIESYDAWFLADHASLSATLQGKIDMVSKPEHQQNPKAFVRQLCDTCRYREPQRLLYLQLAANADLEILRQRCPDGFAVFANRVENVASRWKSLP